MTSDVSTMDQLHSGDASGVASEQTTSSEPMPSLAPPSTSVLSDAPMTDALEAADSQALLQRDSTDDGATSSSFQTPQFSAQTESILKRINANAANAAAAGTPGWEAAREQVMRDMATSDKFPTPTPPRETDSSNREARGGKAHGSTGEGDHTIVKTEGDPTQATPASSGRGRGGGRPRGRGRGGGRGGKRKREERSEDETEDSEVYSPIVTTTKSGRSVQKPSSFVPPPPSPTTNKRKRPYRRNQESAVCRVCLRGTSPASNMIVFCDGCNTPYHRYCHHPPIDQAVVDEVDKEWYCKQCEKERVVPVPESDVTDFISAPNSSSEQRQRYFASLSLGMLVTLLTRATTLKPDLPVFAPDFQARAGSNATAAPTVTQTQSTSNGHAHPHHIVSGPAPAMSMSMPATFPMTSQQFQANASAPLPSTQYVHSGQPDEHVPEGHPPNYPRPGYGLMRTLPPEQEDLQWLVDDDDRYGVFSHMYQVDPHAANASMNGGMSQAQ